MVSHLVEVTFALALGHPSSSQSWAQAASPSPAFSQVLQVSLAWATQVCFPLCPVTLVKSFVLLLASIVCLARLMSCLQ